MREKGVSQQLSKMRSDVIDCESRLKLAFPVFCLNIFDICIFRRNRSSSLDSFLQLQRIANQQFSPSVPRIRDRKVTLHTCLGAQTPL